MHHALRALFAALILLATALPSVQAQESGNAFAVAYIEVTPASTAKAIELLREQARASRAEAGNLRYQILQRIERPNHFAIIDAWESQAARDRNLAAAHTRSFRSALEPLLYSPYDERPSTPILGTAGVGTDGQVYALTHVDIIPTGLEEGMALVESVVQASRREPGAMDIGVIVQNNRRNHMTLFEVWATPEQQVAHLSSEQYRHFRSGLSTLSGALYDERLYRRL